ncbi:helix-turn-helix domain-containing protein, partial [Aliarcobacter butzleri]
MDFELFFNDLLKIYNVKTITDLAEKLNINRSTVAGWKNRETFAPILEYLFLNDKETLKNILNFD